MVNFLHSTGWKICLIFIFIDTFLVMLNGYLRGSLKQHIDAVLGTFWVILLALMWIFTNWKGMLAGLIISFAFGAIIRPAAASLASKMLKY